MRGLKILLFCFIGVLAASCSAPTSIASPTRHVFLTKTQTLPATAIFTPKPSIIHALSPTPAITSIPTYQLSEPGLIALFGSESHSWHSRLAFSPNGLILAQANTSVKLWDVNTHELIRELKLSYREEATNLAFSSDGSLLAVNASDEIATGVASDSHLLIWDVATGELKQDWVQEYATMSTYDGYKPEPTIYKISVNAMAFFPSSSKLAYGSGNKIEIRDVYGKEEPVEWSLGDQMYASEIGIRGDAEFLYILMKWYKNLTFPALYRWKFRIETWHPATKTFRSEIKFEEVDPLDANKWLIGQYLLQEDDVKNTLGSLDLATNQTKKFPFRAGWKYFNSDASLMFVVRKDYSKVSLEAWNTDTWQGPCTFTPAFMNNPLMVTDGAFNPEKTILAVDYDGIISLWDVSPLGQP